MNRAQKARQNRKKYKEKNKKSGSLTVCLNNKTKKNQSHGKYYKQYKLAQGIKRERERERKKRKGGEGGDTTQGNQ